MGNSTKPKVSVIIPAYNAEKFIEEAILSVLSQSYNNLECIVINDGSTDNTLDILKAFGKDIIFHNQSNMGVSQARNSGLKIARGGWIAFLDADDIWHPNKLSVQIADVRTISDANTLLHSTNMSIERNHINSSNYFDLVSFPKLQQKSLLRNPGIEQLKFHFGWLQNTIVHNSLLQKTNLRFNTNRSLYEDFEWLLNLSLHSSWKVTDEVLVEIKRRDNSEICLSAERGKNMIGSSLSMIDILNNYKLQVQSPGDLIKVVNNEICNQYSQLGNLYKNIGDARKAQNAYLRGFKNTNSPKLMIKFLLSKFSLGKLA